jgi:hypothetical protein
LIEEKNAEIAQLECAEQARAEHLRHKAAEHTRLEPAIRAAAREVHESLEALRDGAYARLLTALLAYQRGTGDSYKFASDVSWPTAVFARAEGSDEDLIAYRRRYLAGLGFLD